MNELANTTQEQRGLTVLDGLALQAQMFSSGAAMNLLQLGRVLTEAKPLVPHGEWIGWVRANAHLPARTAQQYMQAYSKFGLNKEMAQLGPTQIIKLLPMSDEEREELLRENDVQAMTTRELDEAIKAQRERLRAEAMAEAKEAITQAEAARDAAERRAEALASRPPEIPEELTRELQESREELARLAEVARESVENANQARRERAELEQDVREQEALLQEQQETINRTQAELLNLKSAQARGDAARPVGDELTLDVLTQAVREFMGVCARMPYMQTTFSTMAQSEKMAYAELLRTVEGWTEGARRALECRAVEGGVVIE